MLEQVELPLIRSYIRINQALSRKYGFLSFNKAQEFFGVYTGISNGLVTLFILTLILPTLRILLQIP
jgi:hypothetical protein